jgi:Zn/Cd-binding protein ZinT
MGVRIKIRRDVSTNWQSVNPILEEGELGLELDTNRIKVGDGKTPWNELPYLVGTPVPPDYNFDDLTDKIRIDNVSIVLGTNGLAVNPDFVQKQALLFALLFG